MPLLLQEIMMWQMNIAVTGKRTSGRTLFFRTFLCSELSAVDRASTIQMEITILSGETCFLSSSTAPQVREAQPRRQYVAQITAEHPDVRWKILAQHFPAYPGAAKSHTDCKEYLARIAADNDIDLIYGST